MAKLLKVTIFGFSYLSMVFLKNKETPYKELPDKELVAAILIETNKERQRIMQEELYDRYAGKIFFKCLSIVKNRETAKDLAHDILVKMFLKLKDYKSISPFYGWVFAITYNHSISYLQKQKRIVLEDVEAGEFNLTTDEIEAENQELKELQLTQLERMVEELSEIERLILFMRYQDGMPVKEIASALQIGESAVKMRLKRSRDRLAELFKQAGYER